MPIIYSPPGIQTMPGGPSEGVTSVIVSGAFSGISVFWVMVLSFSAFVVQADKNNPKPTVKRNKYARPSVFIYTKIITIFMAVTCSHH